MSVLGLWEQYNRWWSSFFEDYVYWRNFYKVKWRQSKLCLSATRSIQIIQGLTRNWFFFGGSDFCVGGSGGYLGELWRLGLVAADLRVTRAADSALLQPYTSRQVQIQDKTWVLSLDVFSVESSSQPDLQASWASRLWGSSYRSHWFIWQLLVWEVDSIHSSATGQLSQENFWRRWSNSCDLTVDPLQMKFDLHICW